MNKRRMECDFDLLPCGWFIIFLYSSIQAMTWAKRLQSFLKVKVTLTLREVILRHDNWHLIIFFDLVLCFIDRIHPQLVHLTFHKYSCIK